MGLYAKKKTQKFGCIQTTKKHCRLHNILCSLARPMLLPSRKALKYTYTIHIFKTLANLCS